MESLDVVMKKIKTEITSDDEEIRSAFLAHFADDVNDFTDAISHAYLNWQALDNKINGDEKRACVSALVHTAITLHILSLKLLISGQIVASGNLMRQVLESIALALLCSGKDIGVLEEFMAGQYKVNKAIRDVTTHSKALGLLKGGVTSLSQAQKFYHKYSHPTWLTIAVGVSRSDQSLYVGANFDKEKVDAYRKEVSGRVGLAEVFSNFIYAVNGNLEKW